LWNAISLTWSGRNPAGPAKHKLSYPSNLEEAIVERTNGHFDSATDKETLYMFSGLAFMVFGAGLILSNPLIRRYLGQVGIGNLAQAALPDIDRYLKLRAM
jgi:hypothetical protein